MACHCLWYWRNKEQHEEEFHRPMHPAQHVMRRMFDYHAAAKANIVVGMVNDVLANIDCSLEGTLLFMGRVQFKEEMSATQLTEEVLQGSKCEECGNQAKKDCAYSRCRNCCKNKGFNCQTHIRSTWIPADRRRRHRMDQPPNQQHQLHEHKKHKQINPFSSFEEFKFPAVVNSMATLTCVQMRSMDDRVNEMAYQTSVEIGGHVFNGILYDQGLDQPRFNNNTRGDYSIDNIHQQQNLNHFYDGATASHHHLLYPPPHPLPSFRPNMPY
ncbi:protein SHI RELATED SEQUENCE 3-like [Trifolium pratense]|uniref:protein SHI RELATED SEQUENCE 3-like n=1 Tax=Trifolium pratense TaxID=57577 RepID=UPI001E694762|nr:protein SHI RELATED SEQUENCE 3-like [Trifolium pratense]